MITISNIDKYYGQLHVLKDVSLQVNKGEIMTILGPSGAGKTTLLQIMGALDVPDSGSVVYQLPGQETAELGSMKAKALSQFRNRNIGFVFQFHELLPEFSALENVMLPALIGGTSRSEAKKRATELLETLGLKDRIQHRPAELSGGEKQRVAVARALINKPCVVFADEPTGSLDSRNSDEIQQLFAELCRSMGQTFVIVTHDKSFANISHRVVMMEDGRIQSIETKTDGV